MTQPQSSSEIKTDKLPEILSILPMIDAALFPKMVLPLLVIQERSIQLVDEAMSRNRIIGLIVAKEPITGETYTKADLHAVGTSALILKMAKTEDNRLQLITQGLERFRVKEFISGKPYPQARVEYLKDTDKKDKETEALMSNMISQFTRIAELSPGLPPEIVTMAKSINEPGILADMEVTRLINYQLEILGLGNKIQSQVKGDMDKRQREYYLREQLKKIKEELGEKDEASVEIEDYKAKIEEKNLSGLADHPPLA